MKTISLPIEVVSYTNNKGDIKPLRVRLQTEDDTVRVVKIDKVISKETQKLAGNPMIIFKCQSVIDSIEKRFEIKYELKTCKWILYKI